ncbi:hypothetical protein ACI48D_13465 [Massilia sp. LXY-6]|uniref:hypothetical protein n=1 Tax=Massilia sp. LXY-6 TaxID=3379823 RepID=UPI003EE19D2D
MAAHLIRILLGILAMFLCAVAAGVLAAFVPIGEKPDGRGFQLPGTVMAGLICAVAMVLRSRRGWPVIDLVASLVGAEAVALCVIALFSGLTGRHLFDPFNWWWLGTISPFIVFPCLAGVIIGGFLQKHRPR